MNITFLLGNGFDIGLGLKSGYKSFYPYFVDKANDDNLIRQAIEKEKKDNYSTWADLEEALGRFTHNISLDQHQKFVQDKVEVDTLLKEYLLSEEEKFDLSKEKIKEIMTNAIKHIRQGNNLEEKELIKSVLNGHVSEDFWYQCITFNYTNCIDKIWSSISEEIVGSHTYGGRTKMERFDKVLHIHGTLSDNEMLIGVNDETQIDNKEILEDETVRWSLIKPYLNKVLGQRKIESAQKIIDKSGIICLYGMSIGKTDNIWWEYIGNWLRTQSSNVLIIYNYDPQYILGHPVNQLIHSEKIRESFLDKTKLDEQNRKLIKDKIIIYDNQNIFSVK